MKDFLALTQAVDYIEQNLLEEFTRQELARACAVSLRKLEELFRYAMHCGIKEYVSKRRMTLAARELSRGRSVTDTAMLLGYHSSEVFSRAFTAEWRVSPSQFVKTWRFTGLFPKMLVAESEEERAMTSHNIDLSEAYEFFAQQRGTYVVCVDIQHMTAINEISQKAGDLAILKQAERMESAAGENMTILRIGGDEFVLLTCSQDEAAAQEAMQKILSHNGECFEFEGREIPLSLWAGIGQIPQENLHCETLKQDWKNVIEESKK